MVYYLHKKTNNLKHEDFIYIIWNKNNYPTPFSSLSLSSEFNHENLCPHEGKFEMDKEKLNDDVISSEITFDKYRYNTKYKKVFEDNHIKVWMKNDLCHKLLRDQKLDILGIKIYKQS